jgi:CSLREA domain-containing protein
VVNSLSDGPANGCQTTPDGCTLRDAITAANGNVDTDQITFSVTGSIFVLTSSLQITSPMTITGPGPDQLAVIGNSMTQPIFGVNPTVGQTVRLEKLKIADARATAFAGGGIGKGGAGSLELDTVWLFDNFASQGGALFLNQGSVTIQNSTLNNNHAQFGGAIVSRRASAMLPPGTLQLTNSTLSDNSAMEFGGALNPAEGSTMTILSSTITANKANDDDNVTGDGGGIYNNASTVAIANTILAGNTVGTGAPAADGQCAGTALTSSGYNLRSAADPNCNGFTATGDTVNANPLLGSLGANGGPTFTIPLLDGSPAINAGNPAASGGAFPACPATDQRGQPRAGGAGVCDVGAFEVQPTSPPVTTPPGTSSAFDPKLAIKKCKKKFRKGPKRKKCIKRAKQRVQA